MKNKQIIFILLFLVINADFNYAQSVANPGLRKELLERLKEDQKVRDEMEAVFSKSDGKPMKLDPVVRERWLSVDKNNTDWLKQVIQKHGWVGKSLVGVDGAHAAWLLLQHADHDVEFQKKCLFLMEKAVKSGEAQGKDFAYLIDRVRTGEGKLQLYGTQMMLKEGGKYVPLPIEDESNVDKRRAAVGLPTLAESIKEFNKL